MNCQKARNAIQRKSSGELSASAVEALATHLRHCPACQEEERLLLWLCEVEGADRLLHEVSESTIENILLRAEKELASSQSRRQSTPRLFADFFDLWRPALLYGAAALLLLLVALPFLRSTPSQWVDEVGSTDTALEARLLLAWDADFDDALYEMDLLLASVLEDEGYGLAGNGDLSLDELAAELLELEGWNI